MSASLDLDDLGHGRVVLLLLERGVGDRPGNGVVLLAGDDQQRAAIGILGVDLGFGPGIQIRGRGLEERLSRGGNGEVLVELLRLVLAHGVRKAVPELIEREWNGTVPIRRVAEHRLGGAKRGDRERQNATEGRRVDRHGRRRKSATGEDLHKKTPEGMSDHRWLLVQPADESVYMV